MKIVLLVTALLGTLLCFTGFSPFGSSPTAAADNLQTQWYPSGQLQSRAVLEHGVREGEASEWYANGKQRCSGRYEQGLREGAWVFYTAAGDIDAARTGNYSAGERLGD